MRRRVLVTGATGFIGRHAVPLLLEHGDEVHAVSLHGTLTDDVSSHHVDLLDAATREKLILEVNPTHILHFAWIATPGVYWQSPLNEHWKDATLDLVRLAKVAGCSRFVGAGSCAEYVWNDEVCNEQNTPLLPNTPYGEAKKSCGLGVCDASDEVCSTSWGRIFHLYGPHEYPSRLVPSVILSLLKNEEAKCTHGNQVRDFLHVEDVASAFVALLGSDVTGPVNIGSGKEVTIGEVVQTIGRMMGVEEKILLGAIEASKNEPRRLVPLVKRLQEEVNWQPLRTLEEGLEETISFWKSTLQA